MSSITQLNTKLGSWKHEEEMHNEWYCDATDLVRRQALIFG